MRIRSQRCSAQTHLHPASDRAKAGSCATTAAANHSSVSISGVWGRVFDALDYPPKVNRPPTGDCIHMYTCKLQLTSTGRNVVTFAFPSHQLRDARWFFNFGEERKKLCLAIPRERNFTSETKENKDFSSGKTRKRNNPIFSCQFSVSKETERRRSEAGERRAEREEKKGTKQGILAP